MFRLTYLLVVLSLCLIASIGSADVMDGAISVWNFNDGTANDLFGRNNGIVNGGVQFVDGRIQLGVDLNGTDASVDIPHGPTMDPMENAWSVAAWAFIRKGGDAWPIVWKGEQLGGGPLFMFRLCTNSDVALTWGANNVKGSVNNEKEPGAITAEGWFHSNRVYKTGEWIHVAEIANGETFNAYLNGEPVLTTESFDGAPFRSTDPKPMTAPYMIYPEQPIQIGVGKGWGGENDFRYLDAIVDEVVIYDRAISHDELNELMDFDWPATAVEAKDKLAVTWAEIKDQ